MYNMKSSLQQHNIIIKTAYHNRVSSDVKGRRREGHRQKGAGGDKQAHKRADGWRTLPASSASCWQAAARCFSPACLS